MGQRFFVEQASTGERVMLSGPEAHHLLHVMRAAVGDNVTLIDGSGREYRARVTQLHRAEVELHVFAAEVVDRELRCELVVGVALPKADRQRWLVEKMTELGVTRVVPLRTRRSVVHPDSSGLARLRRGVVEASKQCGRTRLMEVVELTSLDEFLATAPATALRWMADPTGHVPGPDGARDPHRYVAVGPEGGWTVDELSSAGERGWQVTTLGARILRTETACLALAVLALRDQLATI
jgi:16S rRNA (uracil1498-N3)-methyltransferase